MGRKHKPKLGQHFLSDLGARQRIVDALGDLSQATVVEIGPGQGALTDLLAERAGRLIAVELDRELAPRLRERFAGRPQVRVVEADVLSVDFRELVGGDGESAGPGPSLGGAEVYGAGAREAVAPVKVVGNLPYYITSDILLGLFRTVRERPGLLGTAVLMMQREVAERVAATPGGREFGLLSATTQMHARVEQLFTLGPGSFSPPPEVDSAVVRLLFAPRSAELGVDAAGFDRFLHAAFAQKRKTLSRNLREAGYTAERIAAAWPTTLERMARAEATTLEELAAIFCGLG